MSKGYAVLIVCLILAAAGTTLMSPPVTTGSPAPQVESSGVGPDATCDDTAASTVEAPDPARVPPGCCTSNCNTNKDCDRICGKGNCVCIASSDCCRRCTW